MAAPKKRAGVGASVVPIDPATGAPVIPQPNREGLATAPPMPVPLTMPPTPPVLTVPPELTAAVAPQQAPPQPAPEQPALQMPVVMTPMPEPNTTEPEKPAIVQRVLDATEAVREVAPDDAIAEWFEAVAACLDRLTEVVGVVGQQQQWTTNTIAAMQQQFAGVMGSGNPIKAIMKMMSGKAGPDGG